MSCLRQSAERLLQPLLVVFPVLSLNDHTGMRQAGEPMLVQAFLSEAAVERFDVGVLVGLARLDEEQLNTPGVGPVQHGSPAELIAIVNA